MKEGGGEREKREEIMMPDLFIESPASFELASLEVEEATVSDCVPMPQR